MEIKFYICENNLKDMIQATLTAKPKRRPNLLVWMHKHRVSCQHTSFYAGSYKAVESETRNNEI